MNRDAKQPDRATNDGPMRVERPREGVIVVAVTTDDVEQIITMSEFNAWRVFGCLAFMLGIKLPSKIQKAIQL